MPPPITRALRIISVIMEVIVALKLDTSQLVS
jgi:hypothetical protein